MAESASAIAVVRFADTSGNSIYDKYIVLLLNKQVV